MPGLLGLLSYCTRVALYLYLEASNGRSIVCSDRAIVDGALRRTLVSRGSLISTSVPDTRPDINGHPLFLYLALAHFGISLADLWGKTITPNGVENPLKVHFSRRQWATKRHVAVSP